jgi:hypothetical protein
MIDEPKLMWLIDAGCLLNAQRHVSTGYQFDYKKLRSRIKETVSICRACYLNSTPNPQADAQDRFHSRLRSGPPQGPKIITRLYGLESVHTKHLTS